MEKLKYILEEEHPGFNGITHWLLSLFFFSLLWLMPIGIAKNFVRAISNNWMFTFIIFLIIGGASLLPDLDSSPLQEGGSIAVYQLGFLGRLLSLMFITISGVVWNVMHTKYDKKPPSQHRMLFHSPFIALVIYLVNKFAYPNSSTTIASVGWKNLPFSVYLVVFLAMISIYLGASILFYKVLSLFNAQVHTQFFCYLFMGIGLFTMWKMPYSQLKLIGTTISLGYLLHIIGDVLTKGSAPLFFPVPIPSSISKNPKFTFWSKPYLFGSNFAIETGGAINIILDFVLTGLNIFFAWFIFIR